MTRFLEQDDEGVVLGLLQAWMLEWVYRRLLLLWGQLRLAEVCFQKALKMPYEAQKRHATASKGEVGLRLVGAEIEVCVRLAQIWRNA